MSEETKLEWYEKKLIPCTIQQGDLVIVGKKDRASLPAVYRAYNVLDEGPGIPSKEFPNPPRQMRSGSPAKIEDGAIGIFLMSWGRDESLIFFTNKKLIVLDVYLDLLRPATRTLVEGEISDA